MTQIDLFGDPIAKKNRLKEKYGANPFTILNANEGVWQNRKRRWIQLGIKSEIGRKATTYGTKGWADAKREQGLLSGNKLPSNTSIFDPVVCELMYQWFSPIGGAF